MEEMRKLRKRFDELQKRLESVEKTIPLAYELVHLSERLNVPLNLYSTQLKQMALLNAVRDIAPELEKDEISRLIIQSLLPDRSLNISVITGRVRSQRGKASRRIIAERLGRLESMGIVEYIIGVNNEKLYRLRRQEK
jgi:hypothetical protein